MSWIPGTGGSSSSSKWGFGGSGATGAGGTGTASGWTGGGSGGSKWINMDTQQASYLGGELTGENSAFSDFGFSLTRKQRIYGFVGCLVAGFAISLLGTILLFTGSYAIFAILYSVGFIVSLVGTGFLLGFGKQLKQMFKPIRIVATLIMLAAFAMVWVSAFAIKSAVLAIVFCVILYLAYIWYTLSYIPFMQSVVKNFFAKFF